MAKKTITLILVSLVLFLAGCGNNSSAEKHSSCQGSQTESTEKIVETVSPTEKSTEVATEKATEIPEYDTEWTEISYSSEDADRYTYEVSVKLSPWVLLSNTDILNSIWGEVCHDQPLPGFDDWGLSLYKGKGFNNFYERKDNDVMFFHTMTDMYYCIGSVTIKNTTDGWNIDVDNPREISEGLSCSIDINDANGGYSSIICKTFYNDSSRDYSGLRIEETIKNNNVVIPFVLMAPENFSPKYPNGEYYETIKNGAFFYDWSSMQSGTNGTSVGIIGKDATYVAP